MKVKVEKRIFKKFEGFHLGVLLVNNVENKGSDKKIFSLLNDVENFIQLNYAFENIAKANTISSWRTAFEDLDQEPKKFHCSVERMMRSILKGRKIKHNNKLDDVINYVALKNVIPIAGYDLKNLHNLTLGFAKKSQSFKDVSNSKSRTKKNEVILFDKNGVISRKWNWKKSINAKITTTTSGAVILVDALPPVTRSSLQKVLNELSDTIKMFCGGTIKQAILSEKQTSLK
ncbi:B3/4 domain-containing protein [Nanoarchaeota archaeon]